MFKLNRVTSEEFSVVNVLQFMKANRHKIVYCQIIYQLYSKNDGKTLQVDL